jgi:hypothetical protein
MATIRKSAFALTATERNLYISVINQLNSGPAPTVYAQFVAFHRDMSHRMHTGMGSVGKQRFLPWHRDFLLKLEQQMQAINPAAFIPYWRWSRNRQVPPWMVGFLPTVVLAAGADRPRCPLDAPRGGVADGGTDHQPRCQYGIALYAVYRAC